MDTRTSATQELRGASDARPPIAKARGKFYFGMAVAMSATAFLGFAPTFYLRGLLSEPLGLAPLRPLATVVIVHGVVFSAWMIMLVIQTGLAGNGRVRLHRQLGTAGAALAALVATLGAAAQLASMRRDVSSAAFDSSPFLQSVAIAGLVTLIVFAGLVGAAIYLRGRPEAHKRLILLATIPLLSAATVRLGRVVQLAFPALGPMPLFGQVSADLFLIALVVHDWRTTARLHPATMWGCVVILTAQVLSSGPLRSIPGVVQVVRWLAE